MLLAGSLQLDAVLAGLAELRPVFHSRTKARRTPVCTTSVKDVVRVERFAASRPGSNGAVACIANDPSYWSVPKHGRETNAHAFRIHEGGVLEGTMTWGPLTGAGSNRTREDPLTLGRAHRMAWTEYSSLPGRWGDFRGLVIPVPSIG